MGQCIQKRDNKTTFSAGDQTFNNIFLIYCHSIEDLFLEKKRRERKKNEKINILIISRVVLLNKDIFLHEIVNFIEKKSIPRILFFNILITKLQN